MTPKNIVFAIALASLGYFFNYLSLEVCYGVAFIFGSIFSLIAVSVLGLWWGGLCAAIASSYTYILWHHPYAIIIFTCEAFFIGLCLRKGKNRPNIVIYDLIYWLFIGIPLAILFYYFMMQGNVQQTTLIALKQSINGIFNTLVASVILVHTPLKRWLGIKTTKQPVAYSDALFHLPAMFLMVPAIAMILQINQKEIKAIETNITKSLTQEAANLNKLIDRWLSQNLIVVNEAANLAQKYGVEPSMDTQHDIEQIIKLFPDFHSLFIADKNAISVAAFPLVNKQGRITIGIDYSAREFYKRIKTSLSPVISDVFMGKRVNFEPIFTINSPVIKNNAFAGFACGAINLHELHNMLQNYMSKEDFFFILTDGQHNVVATNIAELKPLDTFIESEQGWSITQITNDVFLYRPVSNNNIPVISLWKEAHYLTSITIPNSQWKLFIQAPLKPFQSHAYTMTIVNLTLIGVFLILSIAICHLISQRFSRSLLSLATITDNLPKKIRQNEPITLPTSAPLELNLLVNNFSKAAETLAQQFNEIESLNQALEQKVIERTSALEHERMRLALVISGTNVGTWEWNVQTGRTKFNERWAEMLGYSLSELEPTSVDTWKRLTCPEDLKQASELLQQHFEGKSEYYEYELRMLHKKGHWVWLLDRGKVATRDAQGKPLMMYGTHFDITERKQWELTLMEQNRALEELRDNLAKKVEEEISKRQKNEQILAHQSKLAAMGEMLGAIAHQWRQPLNSLGLCLQNLKDEYQYGELTADSLESTLHKAMEQLKLMSRTIDDFKDFFKVDKKIVEFDTMVATGNALSLLSAQLKANNIAYNLTCKTHNKTFTELSEIVSCKNKIIKGLKNEFEHVILNLISNAKDAILEAKERGRPEADKSGLISLDFYNDNNMIIIKITDNGGGIPKDIIDRIFEPYFTTKEPSKGTGMGLYLAKQIIEDHMKGSLYVENTQVGACFTIEIPHITG